MTMQGNILKETDSRAYGEPRNLIHNDKENIIDQGVECPTCKGTGRLPKMEPENDQIKELFKAEVREVPSAYFHPIASSPRSSSRRTVTRLPIMHIPSTKEPVKADGTCPPINRKTTHLPEKDRLTPTKNYNIDKPNDKLIRLALMKLSNPEWEVRKEGLEECSQIAQHHPDEMELHMNLVYRTMNYLLTNHRLRDTLFVCQVARKFFARLRSTCKPGFDELVVSLLVRSADSNCNVRCYVNDALDKMVTYIPTGHAIRPLVEKGCKHKNPLVRISTVRLLSDIVTFRTPSALLTFPHLRESCKRIIESGAVLLADNNLGTRAAAKNLFLKLVDDERFETVYETCNIDRELKKKISRTIYALKENPRVES